MRVDAFKLTGRVWGGQRPASSAERERRRAAFVQTQIEACKVESCGVSEPGPGDPRAAVGQVPVRAWSG